MIRNTLWSIIIGFSVSISLVLELAKDLSLPVSRMIVWVLFLAAISGPIIYFILARLTFPKFVNFPAKFRAILLLASLVAGIWFVLAIPIRFITNGEWNLLLFICSVIALSFIFLVFSVWLFARPLKPVEETAISKWGWLLYVLPIIIVWTVYLLAYWPGIMSYDSNNQWEQMVAFKFTDWHPAFHTLTNWLITRLWLSPAAVAFVQISSMSLVIGWGFAEQRRFDAPRWLPWISIPLIVLMPSNGLIMITLWKDVFFSISLLALTILVFKIVMSSGEWIQQSSIAWFYLGITAALVALFRQNGPPVAFGTLICLAIAYWRVWRRYILALILAMGLWMVVRGPIYGLLHVDKVSTMARVPGLGMAFSHLIARYTNTDTQFSADERALLLKIRPERAWPYKCELETNLFFTKLDWANLRDYTPALGYLSARLVFRNPIIFLEHVICNSSFIYQITQSHDSLYEPIETGIYPNRFGIVRASKFPAFAEFVTKWIDQSNQSYNWIIWRVPFWGYLLVGSVVLYSIRSKNTRVFLILLPILFNMLPLSVMTVLQSFRYVYSTQIASLLMSGYFIYLNLRTMDDVPTSIDSL